jgi:hypothetical protein
MAERSNAAVLSRAEGFLLGKRSLGKTVDPKSPEFESILLFFLNAFFCIHPQKLKRSEILLWALCKFGDKIKKS